jgi:hypothetical protein
MAQALNVAKKTEMRDNVAPVFWPDLFLTSFWEYRNDSSNVHRNQ